MKIVFMGTPDFSAIVLKRLAKSYPVAAVVTGKDKQVGRGREFKPSPLKEEATKLGIPVLQYDRVSREGIEDVEALAPDLVITAAFGQILSERFLSIPKLGVLNVHASLLPKYRGASPIQSAILNGDSVTGVTIMRTVKEVDAGDILLAKTIEIGKKENAGELFDRLAELGGEAIVEAVTELESGKATFTPQKESEATHCGMISKADGEIDFSNTAEYLDRFVRAMSPWPSAYTRFEGKTLKIFDIEQVSCGAQGEIGSVVCADKREGLYVQAGDGAIRIKQLQIEGAKRMSDVDFLIGHRVEIGARLGEQ